MLSKKITLFIAKIPQVEGFIKKSKLFRSLVNRFVAGDTLEEAINIVQQLNQQGFYTSLDYLGENVKSLHDVRQTFNEYQNIIRALTTLNEPVHNNNISVKLTQLGLSLPLGNHIAVANLYNLSDIAGSRFIRVDMEEPEYVVRTIEIVKEINKNNVGLVLQSYLHRTYNDVQTLKDSCRIRLCKGAYYVPDNNIAYSEKSIVDKSYVNCVIKLLKDCNQYHAFATHDIDIIDFIIICAKRMGVHPSKFEFQMLYGINPALQKKLLESGFNVRIYIPYGKDWYQYFARRLAERPANLWFLLKNIVKK